MKLQTAIILSVAATLSSCSAIQSLQNTLTTRGSEATAVEQPKQASKETPSAPTVVKTDDAERAVMPALEKDCLDEAINNTNPENIVMSQSKYAPLLEGEWYIISVKNKKIDRDENMPYIYFETKTGNFYANNGCNTLNGSYTLSDQEELQFHNVLATMQFCPDVDFDGDINEVISDGKTWNIALSTTETEHFIDIIKGEKSIMRLRRGISGYIDGHWSVENIAGVKKLTINADIFLDTRELKLHGNSGCNYFNGAIYLDYRIDNSVDFSDIIITSAACPDMDQETALLVSLQQAAMAIPDGEDRLFILDDNNNHLLTLKRIEQVKKN